MLTVLYLLKPDVILHKVVFENILTISCGDYLIEKVILPSVLQETFLKLTLKNRKKCS